MKQIIKKNNPKVSKAKLRSWLKILKTSNFIEKKIRENLRKQHNTTLPRFDVMSALYRAEKALKMNEISGLDIDTELDFQITEFLMSQNYMKHL